MKYTEHRTHTGKTLELLSAFNVTGTYKTKIRLSLDCMFVETHFTINPPIRRGSYGNYIIHLPDGTTSEVPSDFKVTVYEVDGFKEGCA